jgi:hypothetical protein
VVSSGGQGGSSFITADGSNAAAGGTAQGGDGGSGTGAGQVGGNGTDASVSATGGGNANGQIMTGVDGADHP